MRWRIRFENCIKKRKRARIQGSNAMAKMSLFDRPTKVVSKAAQSLSMARNVSIQTPGKSRDQGFYKNANGD